MKKCKQRKAASEYPSCIQVCCPPAMTTRIQAIAFRDHVLFAAVVEELLEFALPHFEPKKSKK